jgi:hypothetical protein
VVQSQVMSCCQVQAPAGAHVSSQVMYGANVRLGHLFACTPTTYTLPRDAAALSDAFARAAHGVEPSVTQPRGMNLWWVVMGTAVCYCNSQSCMIAPAANS